jgi:hypothetical protein
MLSLNMPAAMRDVLIVPDVFLVVFFCGSARSQKIFMTQTDLNVPRLLVGGEICPAISATLKNWGMREEEFEQRNRARWG